MHMYSSLVSFTLHPQLTCMSTMVICHKYPDILAIFYRKSTQPNGQFRRRRFNVEKALKNVRRFRRLSKKRRNVEFRRRLDVEISMFFIKRRKSVQNRRGKIDRARCERAALQVKMITVSLCSSSCRE